MNREQVIQLLKASGNTNPSEAQIQQALKDWSRSSNSRRDPFKSLL